MKIKVLVFGQIAEIISNSEFTLLNIKNTDELTTEIKKQFPALTKINFRIAINKQIINSNTDLNENDEAALLPPFSGG